MPSPRSPPFTASIYWCAAMGPDPHMPWWSGWSNKEQVRGRSVEYSLGFAITEKVRDAITLLPGNAWSPALLMVNHEKAATLRNLPTCSPSVPGR